MKLRLLRAARRLLYHLILTNIVQSFFSGCFSICSINFLKCAASHYYSSFANALVPHRRRRRCCCRYRRRRRHTYTRAYIHTHTHTRSVRRVKQLHFSCSVESTLCLESLNNLGPLRDSPRQPVLPSMRLGANSSTSASRRELRPPSVRQQFHSIVSKGKLPFERNGIALRSFEKCSGRSDRSNDVGEP